MQIAGRIFDKLLSSGRKLHDRINTVRLNRMCIAEPSVVFTRDASVQNTCGRDAIRIGASTTMMSELLTIAPAGRITIGEWSYLGPGTKIWAMESIEIGKRVFVSHNVQIFDNNSHSLSALERHNRYRELMTMGSHQTRETVASAPVVISDDVWLGFNAVVMKGVTVGRGAIIGACAVITHDVPDYAIMVGNPARQVGSAQP